jgi:hypothetical protein
VVGLFLAGPVLFWARTDARGSAVEELFWPICVILTAFFAAAWLGCQAVVFYLLRRFVRWRLVWLGVFMLPVFFVGWKSVCESTTEAEARGILGSRGFADLPPSATDIKACYRWSRACASFQASRQDIESFLATSPRLGYKDTEGYVYSPAKDGLAYLTDPNTSPDPNKTDDGYFARIGKVPLWYRRPLKGPGRVYSGYAFELIFDEESNTVFIRADD